MNLEGIMLSEVSQIEKNKYYMIPLIYGILKSQTHRNIEQTGAYHGMKGGEIGDVIQRVQTSSQKMSKFWGCNVQHGDYSYQ